MSTLRVTGLKQETSTATNISLAVGGGVTVAGISTFYNNTIFTNDVTVSGNISVGGTLTYQDVTDVDSIGIITARNGIHVSGGNVGIGTDADTKLHVSGTVQNIAYFENNKSACLITFSDSTTTNNTQVKIGSEGNDLRFDAGGNEKMRIDSDGRLLVGTDSAANLNNAGGASAREAAAYIFNTSSTTNKRYNLSLIGGSANAAGPAFVLSKTRTTTNTHAAVQSGDGLGEVRFQGSDGTYYVQGARIEAAVDGTPGSQDMPGRLVFSTTADGSSSPTERMRIDSSGRLLVGTTASRSNSVIASTLQIEGSGADAGLSIIRNGGSNGSYLQLASTGGTTQGSLQATRANQPLSQIIFSGSDGSAMRPGAYIFAENDQGTVWASSDCPTRLVFSVTQDSAGSPTERMRINNGGICYLFSATDPLIVSSALGAGTSYRLINGIHSRTSTTTGGTASFQVFTNGNVVNTNDAYGQISDIKLKENIVDASSQWDDFKAIRFRHYNFKEETGYETFTQLGVIAQELELVSPGLVYETPDQDEEGNDLGTTTKVVKSSILTKKALVALQEAMKRIETLEQRLSDAGIA